MLDVCCLLLLLMVLVMVMLMLMLMLLLQVFLCCTNAGIYLFFLSTFCNFAALVHGSRDIMWFLRVVYDANRNHLTISLTWNTEWTFSFSHNACVLWSMDFVFFFFCILYFVFVFVFVPFNLPRIRFLFVALCFVVLLIVFLVQRLSPLYFAYSSVYSAFTILSTDAYLLCYSF